MKKSKIIVTLGISAVILMGALSGCSSTTSSSKTTKSAATKIIYVATQNDYPPFDYVDASGKITGYDVDVIKEINKYLPQYKFQFITGPWATVVPALQANKAQIIADEMDVTPDRAKTFIFSESYFILPCFYTQPAATFLYWLAMDIGRIWTPVSHPGIRILPLYEKTG